MEIPSPLPFFLTMVEKISGTPDTLEKTMEPAFAGPMVFHFIRNFA